ncbi:cytochrome c-type biogenesis CcmF C-terminal domain-containing protein, partial [Acinetobacter baumannii]|uniref:cytochrome c-type biogenesis CcmF C-terminal domain-containing protein n=1 Tax=Acinetobacter baumannii TaxID=470 RepID=UPI001C094353
LYGVAQRLTWAFGLGVAGMLAAYAATSGGPVLAPVAIGLACYIIAGSLIEVGERIQLFRAPAATSWARAKGLPRSAWG